MRRSKNLDEDAEKVDYIRAGRRGSVEAKTPQTNKPKYLEL